MNRFELMAGLFGIQKDGSVPTERFLFLTVEIHEARKFRVFHSARIQSAPQGSCHRSNASILNRRECGQPMVLVL